MGRKPTEFERAVLPHLDAAHNLARWLVRQPALADDVTQDAMVRAFRHFSTFHGGDARAWLLRIVRNAAYTTLAAIKPEAMVADTLADPADDPEAAYRHGEAAGQLDRALAVVTPRTAGVPGAARAGGVFLQTDRRHHRRAGRHRHVPPLARPPDAARRRSAAMTGDCAELGLLIQADIDGELSPTEAARIARHVAGCARCTETQASLAALSSRVRSEVSYHPASGALRLKVTPPRTRLRPLAPFGAGFALAAGLALFLLVPRSGNLSGAIVAGHIRALQPGHLMDMPSTDQHTVKPWFDGRLDFAPPVRDFAADGYPLAGGRLDYLGGRPVAALVYRHRQHVIDVFVWPDAAGSSAAGGRNGYNYETWHRDGMAFWAVSDVSAPELADFARLWRGTP